MKTFLKIVDNSKELIKDEMGSNEVSPTWTNLVNKGINVKVDLNIYNGNSWSFSELKLD